MEKNRIGQTKVDTLMTKECTRCGRCCTNESFMGNLTATGADVQRWMKQRRWDILRFAMIIGPDDNPFADLWIDEVTDVERLRCPFVRKDKGKPTYRCTIYDTRPEICRQYQPFSGKDNDICEVV